MQFKRSTRATVAVLALATTGVAAGPLQAQTAPPRQTQTASPGQMQNALPGRVGSIGYMLGTVSFHDDQQTEWAPAVINYPVTTGDELWTEPNGRVEVLITGSRLRLQGSTQLLALALEENLQRFELARGRVDLRVANLAANQPFEIVTPRGTVGLLQNGDYVVEAGTTEDPTRVGVRTGSAQMLAPNGSRLTIRAGEIGVVSGSADAPTFETLRQAPPPLPPEWAAHDRQYTYAAAPRYTAPYVTGIEELDRYGDWRDEPQYGRVWTPRNVGSDWAPYRDGHWSYVAPWGWTWIDDQPWGFAPSHYGRWVQINGRWVWLPPTSNTRPVYAPAVVGFLDGRGFQTAIGAGAIIAASVAWFALGPREIYVPSYSRDRDYIRRLNMSYVSDQRDIDRRLDYLERRDAARSDAVDPRFVAVNRRFATVVPADDFVRSRAVNRAALKVSPDQLATATVAPVSAPPAPMDRTRTSVPATPAPATKPGQTAPSPRDRPGTASEPTPAPLAGATIARSAIADVPVIGKPTATARATAPGPQIVTPVARSDGAKSRDGSKAVTPPALPPRSANAAPGTPRAPGRPDSGTGDEPRRAPPTATAPTTPPQPERARDKDRDAAPPAQASPPAATPTSPNAAPTQPSPRASPQATPPAGGPPAKVATPPGQGNPPSATPTSPNAAPTQPSPRASPQATPPSGGPPAKVATPPAKDNPPAATPPQPSPRASPQATPPNSGSGARVATPPSDGASPKTAAPNEPSRAQPKGDPKQADGPKSDADDADKRRKN